ncbi:hypothetical protein BX070DRAFT_34406 [Coemansia spiralis]|nr:hypothetical protein BX070DRAFT_34406 [Coemansia spiralis]
MARKRSSSNKKTKSRKGSANPSSSTTPATTPASASFPESIVAAEAAAENAPTTTGSASRAAEQTHVDAEKIDSVDEVLEKPAESENKTSTDEQRSAKIDDSTYKLHISLASEAEEQITEDQLDEQYLRVSANNDNEKNPATSLASAVGRPQMPSIAIEGDESFVLATQIATNDEEADLGILEEHTEDSVNMEDSQAEILSSNIYNSMYRSAATNEKVSADEVHVLESSGVSEAANNAHNDDLDDEEDLEYISTDKAEEEEPSDNSVLRSYVITPSAFADEKEPDVVTHIRAASAASKQVSDLQEDNEPSAAESDGDIASSVTPDVDTRLYTSIADSFIHVSASNDGIDKRDVEAKVASVAGNAADRDDGKLVLFVLFCSFLKRRLLCLAVAYARRGFA